MSSFVFLGDMFLEDFNGGAERTSQSLIDTCPLTDGPSPVAIRCSQLNSDRIAQFKDAHWIIFNFSSLSSENKLEICKNLNYSIVEYDYKFCKYRSLELHQRVEGVPCDCSTREENKINLAFYGLAKKIWFMSSAQKDICVKNVPSINRERVSVLSSVFSAGDLRFIDSLRDNPKEETFLIVKTESWIKNFEECVRYAKERGLKYEVVGNLPYHELLIKLSCSKGLVFLPLGADTCPRLVIEAQMMGCELVLNELVQHKDEEWFATPEMCRKHMETRHQEFWNFYE